MPSIFFPVRYRPAILSLIVSLLFALSSCRNSAELVYLQNRVDREIIPALTTEQTEYTSKPGDILYVSIKSMNAEVNALFNPEANMESQSYNSYQKFTTPQGAYLYGFEIDEDGMLQLPILGKIPVVGMSQRQIERVVQQKADEFLKEAIVKVKFLNYRITVLGEVKSPGVYYNYNNTFSVLDAIAQANGNTNYADIKTVLVVRQKNGSNQLFLLNLSDKSTFLSEAFYLKPNDYVFVEPDKSKNFQLNSQAYSLFLSSVSMLLAVLGFVI